MIPTHIQEKLNERRDELKYGVIQGRAFDAGAAALMEILLTTPAVFMPSDFDSFGSYPSQMNMTGVMATIANNKISPFFAARDSEIERLKTMLGPERGQGSTIVEPSEKLKNSKPPGFYKKERK
jgi:hypothetical protein